jgi:hypothetical protein
MINWGRFKALIAYREPVIVPQGRNYDAAFAVSDNEAWWNAVHATINEAEAETVENARAHNTDPNKCMAAVNAGEGVDLVRRKLIDKRSMALRTMPKVT